MEKSFAKFGLTILLVSWLALILASIGWHSGIRIAEIWHFCLLLIREIGLLAFLLVSALGYGGLALRMINMYRIRQGFYYVCAISLGMGIIAHLVLIIGIFNLLYDIVAWILLIPGIFLALLDLFKYRYEIIKKPNLPETYSIFSTFLFVILLTNCVYPLLTDALAPPLWWDEVAYHLAVPKIYIQNRAIVYIPFIPYSNWPMEAEMLFTLGLLLRSEVLPHLVEWSAFILTCWGLYLIGNRFFSPKIGLLAATVFSATPMAIALSGTALIEPTLTLYVFLATAFFLEWTENQHRKAWILSAIFGGLAASTKLNGALIPLVLGIFMSALIMKRSKSIINAGAHLGLFGLISLAVVAPWYLKTWAHTGNPFWPFFLEILGGRDWDSLGNEYLFGFIRRPNLPLNLQNWITGLWFLTFDYHKFGSSQVRLGSHYLILLPLAILALFLEKNHNSRISQKIFILALIYYTLWFLQTHQARFLMPATPILALLTGYGIAWLFAISGKFTGIVQCAALILLLSINWFLNPNARILVMDRWEYLAGRINREEFLASRAEGYDVFSYVNKNLPEDAYILLALYESRGYYLDRKYAWANPISQRVLRFEQFESHMDLANELKSQGFTHILFRSKGLERYSYIRYSDKIIQLVYDLLRENAILIIRTPDLELYELVYPKIISR